MGEVGEVEVCVWRWGRRRWGRWGGGRGGAVVEVEVEMGGLERGDEAETAVVTDD